MVFRCERSEPFYHFIDRLNESKFNRHVHVLCVVVKDSFTFYFHN